MIDITKVRASRNSYAFDGVSLYLVSYVTGNDGSVISSHAPPPQMKEHPEGAYIEPTVNLNEQEAQSLMDDLWRCGFRPSSGEGNEGQLGATRSHLEDMRKIVSSKLNVEL